MGETPNGQQYIETVPRLGYRFVAAVREFWDEGKEPIVQEQAKSSASIKEMVVRSLAVLPFKPLSSGDADEYFGLGMADALITKLSNIKQVMVRPTSAVRKYIGQEQDPIAAGRELKVEAVLDVNIQKSGERIRITVQLVSVQDRISRWADKFDERFIDIFTVQAEVFGIRVD